MSDQGSGVVGFGREVVTQIGERHVTFMAASLAYYAFISLFPLLLLALVVLSILIDPQTAEEVVVEAQEVLTPEATEVIAAALTDAPGRGGATVAGVGVLLWSSLKVFRGLDTAFSQVYGVEYQESFVEQVIDALIALVAIGVGVIALVAIGTVASMLGGIPALLGPVATFVALLVVFLPLYYVFPDVGMDVGDALPGATFAAAGWTVLQIGFSIYAGQAGGYALYGIVGGVLLLLTWLYLGGIILLVGATINAVLGRRKGLVPRERGVRGRISGNADRQLQQDRDTSREEEGMTDDRDESEPDREDSERDPKTGSDREDSEQDPKAGSDREDSERDPKTGSEREDSEQESETGVDSVHRSEVRSDREVRTRRPEPAPDITELYDRLDEIEATIDARSVNRGRLESDLRRYVRRRIRRGRVRGWGPYLVLLYGTVMTVGAFYFLTGIWAIAAMLVIWLSTLGLYVVMVALGTTFDVLWRVGGIPERIRRWRN